MLRIETALIKGALFDCMLNSWIIEVIEVMGYMRYLRHLDTEYGIPTAQQVNFMIIHYFLYICKDGLKRIDGRLAARSVSFVVVRNRYKI